MSRGVGAALLLLGLAMVLGGLALTEVVTGGRDPGGWFLDERQRRQRKARVLQRYPRVGRWILPAGYAISIAGAVLFAWVAFSAVL